MTVKNVDLKKKLLPLLHLE